MTVKSFTRSTITTDYKYQDFAVGNTPYNQLYAYQSIATQSVGAGGASSVTFSSIPQTFKHLQIRYIVRSSSAGSVDYAFMQFNGDTATNYSRHYVYGDGTTASSFAQATVNAIWAGQSPVASTTANIFGAGVIDILDYANANKNKTVRTLGSYDANGSGRAELTSGAWLSTSAITQITLLGPTSYVQNTQFALYGVN